MIKLTLLIIAGVSWGISGYLIKVPTSSWKIDTGPTVKQPEWVHIQKLVMPFFENVCEESTVPLIMDLSNEFDKTFANGNFLKPQVIDDLQNLKSGKGFLPKGEIFTEYNEDHMNELRIIYEAMYFAKDFDTFYKVTAWARQNLNCGIFVDAIYLAIQNRKDTIKLSIPPPYELLPNYFIRKDVIYKGSLLMVNTDIAISENIRHQGNAYILDANYTVDPFESNENPLAYFQEDIGLNAFYFFQKLKMLPWLNNSIGITPRFGEHVYHTMKQLMNRYNLERYSNGLPELEDLCWDSLVNIPYDSMLTYSNGKEFSHRYTLPSADSEDLVFLQNVENNIVTVATHMKEKGYGKVDILNHLMNILIIGSRSYENVAFKVFSENTILGKESPSVLQHYLTTLRDPIFWKINKKIVNVVNSALTILPSYSKFDLIFPGVELLNVEIKKMQTTFDYFDFDVTDALKTSTKNPTFQVEIEQYRLNHKPFSVKFNISSLVTQKGLAKIFLGPKVLPGELAHKKHLFLLLDYFEINLKKGKNIIARTSEEMKVSDDLTSLKTLYKKLEDAEFGLDALSLKMVESQIGFPSRLMLPKGTTDGLPFQIFVFIAPYVKAGGELATNLESNLDLILSPGYPLDLQVEINDIVNLPNAIMKDVFITHKGQIKMTKEQSYDTKSAEIENKDPLKYYEQPEFKQKKESFDEHLNLEEVVYDTIDSDSSEIDRYTSVLKLPVRPEFTQRKEPFDYRSKKDQYGKKEEVNNDKINENTIENERLMRPLRLSIRPEFTKRKEPFDYKSKKGQYGKKQDYAFKKYDYKSKQDYKQISTDDESKDTNKQVIMDDVSLEDTQKLNSNINEFNETKYFIVKPDKSKVESEEKFFEETIERIKDDNKISLEETFVTELNSMENIQESKYPESIFPMETKKRNPTVYDFIFYKPFDNQDEKIYE